VTVRSAHVLTELEGTAVQFVGLLHIPDDEICLIRIDAATAELAASRGRRPAI
jgi:hypothetical protein